MRAVVIFLLVLHLTGLSAQVVNVDLYTGRPSVTIPLWELRSGTLTYPIVLSYSDQEHIGDLNLGWDSFKWRNHQPDIGRFFNIDPLAEKYVYNSPYAFSENAVTRHRELEGLEKVDFYGSHLRA